MNGRLENKLKVENKIEQFLQGKPKYLHDYFYSLASESDSATTWEAYIREAVFFLEYTHNSVAKQVLKKTTRGDIEKYLIYRQTKNVAGIQYPTSFQYRKRCYNLLKKFFNYLEFTGQVPNNPIKYVKRPSGFDEVKRYYMTQGDMKRILAAISNPDNHDAKWKERNRLIALLFMSTGMRKTAMSEINTSDIDYDNKTLKVTDKRAKTHVYSLSDQMIDQIIKWMDIRKVYLNGQIKEPLFIDDNGQRLSPASIQRMIYKYTEKALGYQLSPHKLRAGFCTIMYELTGNIEEVRRMVGHASIDTTKRYIVDDDNAKEKAANLTAGYLFG